MQRSALLLLGGASAGAAIAYLAQPPPGDVASTAAADAVVEASAEPAVAPPANDSGATAMRIAAHRRALEATDALDLETLILLAAAEPRSRSRDLELEVSLARLVEIDPSRAVALAQSGLLEPRFLPHTFALVARRDVDTALAELALLMPPAKQLRVAYGLLAALGADDSGVRRIASALPMEDRSSFARGALIVRAESDLSGALESALEYDARSLQTYLLPRLAEVGARRDALGALALSEALSDPIQRLQFQHALFNTWAELDPDAVFAWIDEAPEAQVELGTAALLPLARADAGRLLASVETLPRSFRNPARTAVARAYAERDPGAALGLLETMPPGSEREAMLQVIARTYGRQNPDLALAWVESLSPPDPSLMHSVIQGIAEVDTDRAIDVFVAALDAAPLGTANAQLPSVSFSVMMAMLSSNGADVRRLADRLVQTGNPNARSMLSSTLSSWAAREPAAALDWALAHADEIDAVVLPNVVRQIASSDLGLAVSVLDRVPPERRAGWIEGVALQLASSDIDAAMGFVERYRGQPGYDAALGRVIQEMARSDPAAAARALAQSDAPDSMRAAPVMIAREWANRDPAAAARWALQELADTPMRSATLSSIASTWVQRDAAAAERWVFGLESGPSRDAAADGILMAAAQVGRFEPRYLGAYSTDAAGQRGASQAILIIGRNDPSRAGELIEVYLTDPSIRAQTQDRLARFGAGASGAFISGSPGFF